MIRSPQRVLQIVTIAAVSFFAALVMSQPSHAQTGDAVAGVVLERGVLESAQALDVRSEVRGQAALVFIAPDGARVRKGELVAELDDSRFRDERLKGEIELQQTVAELALAKAELDAAKQQGNLHVEIAKKALTAAVLEKERVLGDDGELATKLIQVASEVNVAEARLAAAEKRLKESGDPSNLDLTLMQLEAREAMRVALARKKLLEGAERKQQQAACDLAVSERELGVLMAESKRNAAIAAATSKVAAGNAAKQVAARQLSQIGRQIERCKIRAPQAGVVVHARIGSRRAANATDLELGALIRERQTLLRLPDMSRLQMRVFVNESRIAQVRRGQPAQIEIDAFPDRSFAGAVAHVSNTVEPSSWLQGDVKQYAVIVTMKDPPEQARLGLTALVKIKTK